MQHHMIVPNDRVAGSLPEHQASSAHVADENDLAAAITHRVGEMPDILLAVERLIPHRHSKRSVSSEMVKASPWLILERVTFSPLNHTPLAEPRSSMKSSPSTREMLACWRDT